jgi:hypothetical protein
MWKTNHQVQPRAVKVFRKAGQPNLQVQPPVSCAFRSLFARLPSKPKKSVIGLFCMFRLTHRGPPELRSNSRRMQSILQAWTWDTLSSMVTETSCQDNALRPRDLLRRGRVCEATLIGHEMAPPERRPRRALIVPKGEAFVSNPADRSRRSLSREVQAELHSSSPDRSECRADAVALPC